jgi:hypothetical protein
LGNTAYSPAFGESSTNSGKIREKGAEVLFFSGKMSCNLKSQPLYAEGWP